MSFIALAAEAPLPKVNHRAAVIAHRAGRALAPENTLAAIRNAIRLGVDYVELDVRTSKDGKLVIMHDSTVDRTTDGKGSVRELDLAQLKALDAGKKFGDAFAGERIPTFDEALEACRGKVNLYLDQKDAAIPVVLESLKRQRMTKEVIVYAGLDTLREWKRLAPEIPVMPTLPGEHLKKGGPAAFRAQFAGDILEGNAARWNADLVEEAHAAGAKVFLDALGPYDNPDGFQKLLDWGVDGIQTDHPDQLIEALK